jgi:hypothetical protein
MKTILGRLMYRSPFAKAVLLGLMAFGGAAGPVLGQETVSGKFTLTENTRLGTKILPAGTYKFSVEPTGVTQSVGSIHGARQVVRVVVQPETKGGSVSILFVMATRDAQAAYSSRLVLTPTNGGKIMHTMYLDQQGLLLDFDWSSPKDKTQMIAQNARTETVAASKATD